MESWKDIIGREGSYQISSYGRVRSKTRTIIAMSPRGKIATRTYRGKILSTKTGKQPYPLVALALNSKLEKRYIHELVLTHFVGPKPQNLEACHNDGNPNNNRLDNLRWDTRSANSLDRKIHGTMNALSGEKCPLSKLKNADIPQIVKLHKSGKSMRAIGREFKISHHSISRILAGVAFPDATR